MYIFKAARLPYKEEEEKEELPVSFFFFVIAGLLPEFSLSISYIFGILRCLKVVSAHVNLKSWTLLKKTSSAAIYIKPKSLLFK